MRSSWAPIPSGRSSATSSGRKSPTASPGGRATSRCTWWSGRLAVAVMRVLLIGSGGREHALAWGLARSPGLGELHAAPGNPGIEQVATCHDVGVGDLAGLTELAVSLR